jgi:hypothetical protein
MKRVFIFPERGENVAQPKRSYVLPFKPFGRCSARDITAEKSRQGIISAAANLFLDKRIEF